MEVFTRRWYELLTYHLIHSTNGVRQTDVYVCSRAEMAERLTFAELQTIRFDWFNPLAPTSSFA
jgi:hypothetical protein